MAPARSLRTTFSHVAAFPAMSVRSIASSVSPPVRSLSLWQVTQYWSSTARWDAEVTGGASGCCSAARVDVPAALGRSAMTPTNMPIRYASINRFPSCETVCFYTKPQSSLGHRPEAVNLRPRWCTGPDPTMTRVRSWYPTPRAVTYAVPVVARSVVAGLAMRFGEEREQDESTEGGVRRDAAGSRRRPYRGAGAMGAVPRPERG